jgi:hypothetical protein
VHETEELQSGEVIESLYFDCRRTCLVLHSLRHDEFICVFVGRVCDYQTSLWRIYVWA